MAGMPKQPIVIGIFSLLADLLYRSLGSRSKLQQWQSGRESINQIELAAQIGTKPSASCLSSSPWAWRKTILTGAKTSY